MKYFYYINLDERGEFFADVRDRWDSTVFEIHGCDIFEDGFMDDKHDIAGLEFYLRDLGILAPKDRLHCAVLGGVA